VSVKKAAKKGTDKQCRNSAKRARGRPFEKGHPHAWKPGESGNPAGRPKSMTFSEACRKLLAEIEDEKEQKTVAEKLAEAAIGFAKLGSHQHLKEINDRVEGKAKQTVEIVGTPKERLAAALGLPPEAIPDAE
jgi:hypothetical protein